MLLQAKLHLNICIAWVLIAGCYDFIAFFIVMILNFVNYSMSSSGMHWSDQLCTCKYSTPSKLLALMECLQILW